MIQALCCYLVFVCVFVLLCSLGTYTHCTCCVIGLINDVEVNAYAKLSVKRSDSGRIVTELKASIVSATLRQLVWNIHAYVW